MSLTPENARLAGQLQSQIDQLTGYVSNLQAVISNAGTIDSATVRFNVGGVANQMESDTPMSITDSATLLNALIAIYQADAAALQTRLDAITA